MNRILGSDLEINEKNSVNEQSPSGDVISVGTVSGEGIVIGKDIDIGTININNLTKELEKVPSEYSESLRKFSENLNKEFQKYKVPEEKTNQIQEAIVRLGKEVEDVTPGKEKINFVKQTNIQAQTVDLVDKVLNALPSAAEIITTFTPLSPFSKLIGKGVEAIVDAVKQGR